MGLATVGQMSRTTLRLERQLKQVATPRLQQAVRLLQLSSLDFAHEVTALMGRNPFLELDDSETPGEASANAAERTEIHADADARVDHAAPERPAELDAALVCNEDLQNESCGLDGSDGSDGLDGSGEGAGTDAANADHASAPGEPVDLDEDVRIGAAVDSAADDSVLTLGSSVDSACSNDDRVSAVERMPAAPGLRELLIRQAGWLRLSVRDHGLVCALIESLDDDGYLRIGLDELALLAGCEPRPDASELRAALHRVQAMEPTGVGARTLAECLLLQLDGTEPADVAAAADTVLARQILTQHLARLAQRDLTGLARVLGCGLDAVNRAWRQIRQLDPRPGARHSSALAPFVTPDLTVRKLRGVWRVELNPAIAPKLRVNRLYAELFARHREVGHGGHVELADHLKEARWIVRNIVQRLATIEAVGEAILRHQQRFLEFGPLAMRPLGLCEIAAEVGVHESTVCRVTNNKFMATPVGTFELKYFFSRALPTLAGGACSATAVRGVIAKLIAAESAARPLSDSDITRHLNRQGLSVARRTVTKYRQQLKLAVAGQRRSLACG